MTRNEYERQKEQIELMLFKTLSATIEHAMDFDKKAVRNNLNHFNNTLADLQELTGAKQGPKAEKTNKENPEGDPA